MANKPYPIRVVIADGHQDVRQSIHKLLIPRVDYSVVGEACNGSAAVALTRRLKPDVLLLGVGPGQEDGLHVLAELKLNLSHVPTVVMSTSVEPAEVLNAFRLGARAFISKTSLTRLLLESIQSVVDGHYWFDNDSVKILLDTLREFLPNGSQIEVPCSYRLTPRELDVVSRVANGHSNKQIGREFCISERTVKHHLTNIFLKLSVSSRLELAMFALNHDIVKNHTAGFARRAPQNM